MILESKKMFPYELELNARLITSAALVTTPTGVLAKLSNLDGNVYLDALRSIKIFKMGSFARGSTERFHEHNS